MYTDAEHRVSKALKSIARNEDIKEYIQNSNELFPLFKKAAARFISGLSRTDGIERIPCYQKWDIKYLSNVLPKHT
ncbi:hypothetical protein [Psychrobacillus sp.]|uniref:hypothetical protein n=1 Tax=Psychrobacillus sp. TaxID=1871623 RepID=UPI0028BDD8EE|nr:hypothetical protein [Psychrobacillus sp.]